MILLPDLQHQSEAEPIPLKLRNEMQYFEAFMESGGINHDAAALQNSAEQFVIAMNQLQCPIPNLNIQSELSIHEISIFNRAIESGRRAKVNEASMYYKF